MNLTFDYETELLLRALSAVQEKASTALPGVELTVSLGKVPTGDCAVSLTDAAACGAGRRSLHLSITQGQATFWLLQKPYFSEEAPEVYAYPVNPPWMNWSLSQTLWEQVCKHFGPAEPPAAA